MAKKLAVRYVVPVDGQLKRILSIREASSGDLLITTHNNGLGNLRPEGGLLRIKESRDCLHVSPSTPGNTVHGITVHTDGTTDHHYLNSDALTRHAFDAIYARTVPDPNDLPSMEGQPKGDLIKFPAYDHTRLTMHYGVWFCALEDADRFIDTGIFNCVVSRFHHRFAVIIPMGYSPQPSQRYSSILRFGTTSEERASPEYKAAKRRIGPSAGVTPNELAPYVVYDFNELISRPLGRIGWAKHDKPPPTQRINFYAHPPYQ